MRETLVCVAAATMLLAGAGTLQARDRSHVSSAAARNLVASLTSQKLEAIAVQDPEHPHHFVAALLIPGVQLLLVSAETTAPEYVQTQIAQRQFREAYSTLNSAAVLPSKLFFQDLGCDGLVGTSDSVDIMYEQGVNQTIFDGDWKRQKLSKEAYAERLQKADTSYSHLLSLLTEAARKLSSDASR